MAILDKSSAEDTTTSTYSNRPQARPPATSRTTVVAESKHQNQTQITTQQVATIEKISDSSNYVATAPFIGEADHFEVDCFEGDLFTTVRVTSDPMWTSAKNVRTGETGLIPSSILCCSTDNEDDDTTPMMAIENHDGEPGHSELSFVKGDTFSRVVLMNDNRFFMATLDRTNERGIVEASMLMRM